MAPGARRSLMNCCWLHQIDQRRMHDWDGRAWRAPPRVSCVHGCVAWRVLLRMRAYVPVRVPMYAVRDAGRGHDAFVLLCACPVHALLLCIDSRTTALHCPTCAPLLVSVHADCYTHVSTILRPRRPQVSVFKCSSVDLFLPMRPRHPAPCYVHRVARARSLSL